MKYNKPLLKVLLVLCIILPVFSYAQQVSGIMHKALLLPDKVLAGIDKGTSKLSTLLDKQTSRYLSSLQHCYSCLF